MSSTEDRLAQLLEEARAHQETVRLQQPQEGPTPEQLQARANELRAAEQQAQGVTSATSPFAPNLGPLRGAYETAQVAGNTVANNAQLRGLGLQNSLLQGLQKFGWQGGPMVPAPQAMLEENRIRGRALQDLNAALYDEEPFGSNMGDALTFVAEASLGGKPFTHANPTKQLLGRSAQEGALGGLHAGATVGMSDDEKEAMIAQGLITGAIAPHAIGGLMKIGGKTMRFSADRLERIAKLVKIEKMYNASGLLLASELLGSKSLAKMTAALDNIPFLGLNRTRERQELWFQQTGESLVNRFGRGSVPVRGDTTAARKELGRILYNTYHRNYDMVHQNYERVAWRLDELPINVQSKVTMKRLQSAAQEMLDAEMRLPKGARSEDLITTLKGYVDPGTLTWADSVKLLRRVKEQAVMQMEKAVKKETTKEYGAALNQLEAALYADMKDYAQYGDKYLREHPQKGQSLIAQLEEANESFRRLVLPFYKSEVLADVTRGEDFAIDNIVGTFLERTASIRGRNYPVSGRPGSKRAFEGDVTTRSPMDDMDTIPPQAQNIVRGLMMREAFDRGTKGGAFLDPAVFRDELSAMQKHWGVAFTKEQQELLEGYVTLAQQAKRAFKSASDMGAVTGGFGGMAMLGGIGFGISQASEVEGGQSLLPYLATVWGARFLLGSKAGNSALRMAAKVDDWSTKEGRMVLHVANAAMTRYLTTHYNEIYEGIKGFPIEKAPELFEHPVL